MSGAANAKEAALLAGRSALESSQLDAYREDLADWIGSVLGQRLSAAGFIHAIDNGVLLCRVARKVHADEVRLELHGVEACT